MGLITKIKPRRIAVFRALQLGDLLCSIPAIRALKKASQSSEITLLGLPWAEKFVERFSHYFTDFIHFPGYPGLPEQSFNASKIIPFLLRMKMERFDLIIQMHGNGSIVNPYMKLMGSKQLAGYYEENQYCPDDKSFLIYPEGMNEVEKHIHLMEKLGIPSEGTDLEFPIYNEERAEFAKLCRDTGLKSQKYICIHPGARDSKRWWSAEKFAFVADRMAEKGYKIVLTGTLQERSIIDAVVDRMHYPAINLGGKTDLGTLAALIESSKMVLSNDTGVSHIAAAVKTPSIVIFLSSDPVRWAPVNKKLHHIILPEDALNVELVLWNAEQLLSEINSLDYNKSA